MMRNKLPEVSSPKRGNPFFLSEVFLTNSGAVIICRHNSKKEGCVPEIDLSAEKKFRTFSLLTFQTIGPRRSRCFGGRAFGCLGDAFRNRSGFHWFDSRPSGRLILCSLRKVKAVSCLRCQPKGRKTFLPPKNPVWLPRFSEARMNRAV